MAIDKQIEEDSRKFKKECKILLLGSGESGKSTIVKQMKIIHQNGYSKDELLLYRLTVIKNLVDSAQAIVLALRKFVESGRSEHFSLLARVLQLSASTFGVHPTAHPLCNPCVSLSSSHLS